MEIPTCILLLLMAMTNLMMGAPILTVREIEGSLTVKEKVDLTRMQKHAHLWAQELLTDKDKLNFLTAAQKIRELSLLTLTLQSLTNYTVTTQLSHPQTTSREGERPGEAQSRKTESLTTT
jgi:hypothetical protein